MCVCVCVSETSLLKPGLKVGLVRRKICQMDGERLGN